ncbi:MAG: M1 family metallopeptidase [Acidimicrobiales bacterium]
MTDQPDEYRLSRNVVPSRYEIRLEPDLTAHAFAGEVRVAVDISNSTQIIVVNALELEIQQATVELDGEKIPATVSYDAERERATFDFGREVAAGPATLSYGFTGILNDKLAGFYRSTFRDADGRDRVIATTQMESTDARRAFPCWDEPDFKASFKVTLVVDPDLMAVANGAEESSEIVDGKKVVTFTETMKMSTYLVAFVVGPLEATEAVDVDGTPLRVVHVPGRAHLADFALDIGAHALRYFAEYFGSPYPGDKLDLIALPDFAFGAMENVGAVTFRETALLVDPETASRLDRERVADVVAHEIAHMWFGDLVTMKWWNGIWLNEAFATFMELLCVDSYRPEWDRWVSFSTGRASAMTTDSTAHTRPIEFPVVAPAEADGMFDVLTYQKGASVVRMLERYLGEDRFRDGIRLYMSKHAYGNTETTDLWDAIEEATGEPVRAMMDSWIFQAGHPVVSASLGSKGDTLELEQRRFRYTPSPEDAEVLWKVPVMVRVSVDGVTAEHREILSEARGAIDLGGKPDWVVVNAGGSGVYRSRYDAELLAAATADLEGLTAIERFNLVSDTWAAVLAGQSPATDFLDLVRAFTMEPDPSVWAAVLGPLELTDRVLGEHAGLQAMVRGLVSPGVDRVGWVKAAGEPEKIGTLRAALIGALAGIGADADARSRVLALHASYLNDRSSVDPDLVATAVSVTARAGGESDFQSFLDRFRNPISPQEEVRYLYALAAFRNLGLAQRTLDLAVDEVRSQNAPYLIGSVLANPAAGGMAWEWLEERWPELLDRFPVNSHARMLDTVSQLFVEPGLADRVSAFLAANPIKSGQRTVEQAIDRLVAHAAFAERERERLSSALS